MATFNPASPASAHRLPLGATVHRRRRSTGGTFDPRAAGGATTATIDTGYASVNAVACASPRLCTAVDGDRAEITFDPVSPGAPTPVADDPSDLNGVACPSPSF